MARRYGVGVRPRVTEAIGYRVDHSWVAMPGAVDDSGRLRQVRGVTPAPGLYTLGLPWQHTRGSALPGWVGVDAEFVVDQIGRPRRGWQRRDWRRRDAVMR